MSYFPYVNYMSVQAIKCVVFNLFLSFLILLKNLHGNPTGRTAKSRAAWVEEKGIEDSSATFICLAFPHHGILRGWGSIKVPGFSLAQPLATAVA